MSFVQLEFLMFLLIVFPLYWSARDARQQNIVLVAASAAFYGWVSPWWVAVLYTSAVVDFVSGQLMVRAPRHRRLWLGISLGSNLGLLLYFKYFGFFIENVGVALTALGLAPHPVILSILLPAGISFYTFQTMSYTIDIYRGELRPRTNLIDYLAFVSFFPQLLAGPIERASSLLVQLERRRTFSVEKLREGIDLALYGAFKKLVVADTLAPFIDKVFVHADPSGMLIWAATTAFMVQIYADFSGYTDIARGIARAMGIELVKNFDEPWRATTTPEFWQRWHISLSTWIRDYVLTPLLGNTERIGPGRFAYAVIVTMVVMGAWHGAGWNFIAFGLFQALCILGYTYTTRHLPTWTQRIPGGRVLAAAFHIVVIGEIGALMFREPSLRRFLHFMSIAPWSGTEDERRASLVILTLAAVLSLPGVVEHVARRTLLPRLEGSPWRAPVQTVTWSVMLLLIIVCYRSSTYDFIYFKF